MRFTAASVPATALGAGSREVDISFGSEQIGAHFRFSDFDSQFCFVFDKGCHAGPLLKYLAKILVFGIPSRQHLRPVHAHPCSLLSIAEEMSQLPFLKACVRSEHFWRIGRSR